MPRPVTVDWIGAPTNCVTVAPFIVLRLMLSVDTVWALAVPATSRAVAGVAVPMPTYALLLIRMASVSDTPVTT